jgi:hypothetical protein
MPAGGVKNPIRDGGLVPEPARKANCLAIAQVAQGTQAPGIDLHPLLAVEIGLVRDWDQLNNRSLTPRARQVSDKAQSMDMRQVRQIQIHQLSAQAFVPPGRNARTQGRITRLESTIPHFAQDQLPLIRQRVRVMDAVQDNRREQGFYRRISRSPNSSSGTHTDRIIWPILVLPSGE